MNAESIVVSLEWAKKLKEAGWPQGEDSHCWVRDDREDDFECVPTAGYNWTDWPAHAAYREKFFAPTAEEILKRLPVRLESKWLNITPFEDGTWWVGFFDSLREPTRPSVGERTLADAAASMYCYLSVAQLLPTP